MANLGTLQTKLDPRHVTVKSFAVGSGAVTGKPVVHPALLKRRVPSWKRDGMLPNAGLVGSPAASGVLSGAVTTLTVPTARIQVRLYYRPNGFYIDSTLSAADGTFSFSQIDSLDAGNYFVLAFDDESGVQYNAIVFDRLTPVG